MDEGRVKMQYGWARVTPVESPEDKRNRMARQRSEAAAMAELSRQQRLQLVCECQSCYHIWNLRSVSQCEHVFAGKCQGCGGELGQPFRYDPQNGDRIKL